MTAESKLKKHIIDPFARNMGQKLQSYRYHDICGEDQLLTNNQGIDVISHQLELQFEGNAPIFISWATIDGWHQFSLSISENSFCDGVEIFTPQKDQWEQLIGKRLQGLQVFGYRENEITTIECGTNKQTTDLYYNEPHLLVLEFENNLPLGIANFYLADDFKPKLPMGDDIWILFRREDIVQFAEKLFLERLDH
ncbi:hypothetical protein V9K67_21820 [Paraflavisolibacter sp. H34]|uniref:hypothetical protein n=1 Tax=Huijunlia imazamoxiresistens TaxID=3127457 RepID=UPI0030193807